MIASDPGLLVLHALRLTGFADAATVADRIDHDRATVDGHLADAAHDGFARERTGARPGWSLTDEGRKENERLLAEELDHHGHREAITETYLRFGELNRRLLEVCSAWQVVDLDAGLLNDHADAAYDRAVIDRLVAVDTEAQPLCAQLGSRLGRFLGYGPRLTTAIDRVIAGDNDWFTRPTIDSYHTIWFELHEDLLATLGLDRSAETAPAGQPETAAEHEQKEP